MPSSEILRLSRLQFLTSDELGHFLAQLPFLLRRLATTTVAEEEWSAERVRGSILWGKTFGGRAATGLPHLFVTAPARRAYQTPENELLVLLLDATVELGERSPPRWRLSGSETMGKVVSQRVAEASRWRQSRMLLEVERRPLTPLKLARIRNGRHRRRYQSALYAFHVYQLLVEQLNREAIRHSVENHGLVASDDATLFELLCTFQTIEALENLGWKWSPLHLFWGGLRLKARRGDEDLELYYQHTPQDLSKGSLYRDIQTAHGLQTGALRPDLVLRKNNDTGTAWLLVEVKGGQKAGTKYARDAVQNLLAYRRAFDPVLAPVKTQYGLGIAWGKELKPAATSEIALCTPDHIQDGLKDIFG